MPPSRTFNCPVCSAPVPFEEPSLQVRCAYCGNTVVVPPELRPQAGPPLVFEQQHAGSASPKKGGKWFVWLILSVGLLPALIGLGPEIGRRVLTFLKPFARKEISFGGTGRSDGLLQNAKHVAVDDQGNVYVSEADSLRIQKFDPMGQFLNSWTIDEPETDKFYRRRGPDALVAGPSGRVYLLWHRSLFVYDGNTGRRIARHTPDGYTLTGSMILSNNQLITINDGGFDDTLLWIDPETGRIVRSVPKLLSSIADASLFTSSMKLAADRLGNLFVLYGFSDEHAGIYRFSPEGRYLDRMSTSPDPAHPSRFMASLGVDGQGRLYINDLAEIVVLGADGRYLDTIQRGAFGGWAEDFVFDRKGRLIVLNSHTSKITLLRVPVA